MNPIKRLTVAMVVFAALASASPLMPTVTFTLSPSAGFLAGAPGTSVGWGYMISSVDNDLTAMVVFIQSFSFGDATPVGDFPDLGVPSDGVMDGAPLTVDWSPNVSGLQYDIDAGALLGASTRGLMTLTYDVYSGTDLENAVESGLTVNAQMHGEDVNAEVDVTPEPGGATLFVLGAAGLLVWGWKLRGPVRRKRS